MTTDKRLFVGGLFSGVTEIELRERFSKFGDVAAIDIRSKRGDDGLPQKTFAYLDVNITEDNLKKCMKAYNKTKWRGGELQLQIAKESFISRLKKEQETSEPGEQHDSAEKEDGHSKVKDMVVKSAAPGTLVEDMKNWVVGKYGKVLPIMYVRKKDKSKVIKYDPSKYCHGNKTLEPKKTKGQPVDEVGMVTPVDDLTWELEEKKPTGSGQGSKLNSSSDESSEAERDEGSKVDSAHCTNHGTNNRAGLTAHKDRPTLSSSPVNRASLPSWLDSSDSDMDTASARSRPAKSKQGHDEETNVISKTTTPQSSALTKAGPSLAQTKKELSASRRQGVVPNATNKSPGADKRSDATSDAKASVSTKKSQTQQKSVVSSSKRRYDSDSSVEADLEVSSKHTGALVEKKRPRTKARKSSTIEPPCVYDSDDSDDVGNVGHKGAHFDKHSQKTPNPSVVSFESDDDLDIDLTRPSGIQSSRHGRNNPRSFCNVEEFSSGFQEDVKDAGPRRYDSDESDDVDVLDLIESGNMNKLYQHSKVLTMHKSQSAPANREAADSASDVHLKSKLLKLTRSFDDAQQIGEYVAKEVETPGKISIGDVKRRKMSKEESVGKIGSVAKSAKVKSPDEDDKIPIGTPKQISHSKKESESKTPLVPKATNMEKQDGESSLVVRKRPRVSAGSSKTGTPTADTEPLKQAPANEKKSRQKKVTSAGESSVVANVVVSEHQSKEEKHALSNQKRLESLKQKEAAMKTQKSLLQKALASVDKISTMGKKTIFNSDSEDEGGCPAPAAVQVSGTAASAKSDANISCGSSDEDEESDDTSVSSSDDSAMGENDIKKEEDMEKLTSKRSAKGPVLFESSEESTDDEDSEAEGKKEDRRFRIRPEFEGKAGRKLMELQTRFGTDQRFKMDERFQQSDLEDDSDVGDADPGSAEAMTSSEKQHNLDILKAVIGSPLARGPAQKEIKTFKDITKLQYDPSKEDHQRFEVKPDQSQKKEKAKKRKKKTDISSSSQTEEPIPEVTQETFFEVKTNLKDAFEKGESKPFSLLSTFGAEDTDAKRGDKGDAPTTKTIDNTTKLSWQQPFGYDSSSEEEEEPNPIANVRQSEEKKSAKAVDVFKTKKETFFFSKDDPRITEGIEYFHRKEDLATIREKWLEQRPKLVEAYRMKRKNALRRNRQQKVKSSAPSSLSTRGPKGAPRGRRW